MGFLGRTRFSARLLRIGFAGSGANLQRFWDHPAQRLGVGAVHGGEIFAVEESVRAGEKCWCVHRRGELLPDFGMRMADLLFCRFGGTTVSYRDVAARIAVSAGGGRVPPSGGADQDEG